MHGISHLLIKFKDELIILKGLNIVLFQTLTIKWILQRTENLNTDDSIEERGYWFQISWNRRKSFIETFLTLMLKLLLDSLKPIFYWLGENYDQTDILNY